MARTFNCGIGMIVLVPAARAQEARAIFEDGGETVFEIGTVTKATGERVVIDNLEALCRG